MKKTKSIVSMALCLFAICGCMNFSEDSAVVTPEKPTALFNGKNLDGWYTFLKGKGRDNDPGKVFTVEDGLLKISGREQGSITTKKEYRDYHLIVEYRMKAKKEGALSGIVFHSTGADGAVEGAWMAGVETSLAVPGTGDLCLAAPEGDKDYSLAAKVLPGRKEGEPYAYNPRTKTNTVLRAGEILLRRAGRTKEPFAPEWNVCELIADGEKVSVMLNACVVNAAEMVAPSAGRIQIKSVSGEIEIRKIEIRPIKRSAEYYLEKVNAIQKKYTERSSGHITAKAVEANEYIEKIIADKERLMLTSKEVAQLWQNYASRGISLYRDDVFLKGYENAVKENPDITKSGIFVARLMTHYRLLKEIPHFPKKKSEIKFGQTLKSMGVKEKKTVHLKDHWNPTNMTAVIQGFVNDTNVTTIVFDKMPSPYFIESVKFGSDVNGKRVLLKSGVTVQRAPWALRHLCPKKPGPMFSINCAKNLIIESDAANPREAVITFYDSREARLKVNRREGDSCIKIGGGKRYSDASFNIVIRNLHLRDSEQDGIAIGALWRPPEEIFVENVVMDSNFRQGTSPCAYYSLYFKDCEFINTRGGPPSAGCDVEPWAAYLCTGILYFFDCKFANNDGGGLEFATATKNPLLCYVKNCDFLPTSRFQFNITARPTGYIAAGRRAYSDIIFEDCRFNSRGSSITFMPCPIYNTTFRNCVIRDARTTAAKAAAKMGPPPISASLNRDFGIPELTGELKAEIKFENVRIEGFENSAPLGVSDELGMLSIKNVFSGVVDWNGKKVDFSKVAYDAPDLNEPKTVYVDLKKLKTPAKVVKPDEIIEDSNCRLSYAGAWWISEPQHSYYFYAKKGREISFDFTLSYSRFVKQRPLKTLHIVGPSGKAVKFAEITDGKKRLSYTALETGWHRFSPGEDIIPKNMHVYSGGQWAVSGVKGTRFAWQADTVSECFAKFQLKDKTKPFTGYFEVPAGGKECRVRVSYGGFELYDPAGNLVDKIGARDYMGRYVFTIKPSTDKAEIWSFRTPATRAGGGVRALRFYAPLNGIWADSPEALPLEYTDHFVPEKKAVLPAKVAVRAIDRSILSTEQKAKLDAVIAARKEFAEKKVNTLLLPALEAQIAKMESGERDDDTEKQLSDLRRGLDLVKRAAEMEAKAATEARDVAEAAAFVQAFADLLGPDKTTFGATFPKDAVEYEYPVDLNPTIDAITAVMKEAAAKLETAVIQQRIDDAWQKGGGTVVIEAGEHLIGTIRLRSNVTLYLRSGAVLKASRNLADYDGWKNDELEPVAPPKPGDPNNYMINWYRALIRLHCATNAAIVGESGSVIDGCNTFDLQGEERYRGAHGITAMYATNCVFRGYTMRRTGNWAHHFRMGRNLKFSDLSVDAGHDGIHLRMCDAVEISKCRFRTGDDAVAGFGNSNIHVHDCDISSACSAFRFGGRHVLIENCVVHGPCDFPFRGSLPLDVKKSGGEGAPRAGRRNMLSLFTYFSMKGYGLKENAGDIVLRNIRVSGAARFLRYNYSGKEVWSTGVPMDSITFENVVATGLRNSLCVYGDEKVPLRLKMKNCRLSFASGQSELMRGANLGIELSDVEVKGVNGSVLRNYGPAVEIKAKNLKGVEPTAVKATGRFYDTPI